MFSKMLRILQNTKKEGIRSIVKRIRMRYFNFYYHLIRLLFTKKNKNKRILGVWDYNVLPWSVGDPLVFVQKLSILKIEKHAEKIDMCVVYEKAYPGGIRNESKKYTQDIIRDYMIDVLPLFSTCPFLGSIFQFSERKEFYSFLKSNIEHYDIFPPLYEHLEGSYNFVGDEPHLNEIQDFYAKNGYIPFLRIGGREKQWVRWFFQNKLSENKLPVVVSMRQPQKQNDERNADPLGWSAFFDMCKQDFHDVVFVVVGTRDEVFDGLRDKANVIIAKDFGTTIVEDLALVHFSFIYMGTTSGINMIAMFGDTPYLIFKMPKLHKYGLKEGEQFSFANTNQKVFSTDIKVTPELLMGEFRKLFMNLNREEWKHRVFN